MDDWKTTVDTTMRQLGQSRATHHIIDKALLSACPPLAQLDAYYAEKLSSQATADLRRHIIFCDRCARELLLREQITDDLIEDESTDLIQKVYTVTPPPVPAPAAPPPSANAWLTLFDQRKAFIVMVAVILFLLLLLLLWIRTK